MPGGEGKECADDTRPEVGTGRVVVVVTVSEQRQMEVWLAVTVACVCTHRATDTPDGQNTAQYPEQEMRDDEPADDERDVSETETDAGECRQPGVAVLPRQRVDAGDVVGFQGVSHAKKAGCRQDTERSPHSHSPSVVGTTRCPGSGVVIG
jgi:hypothetical protein